MNIKTGDKVAVYRLNSDGTRHSLRFRGTVSRIVQDDHFQSGVSYCVKSWRGLVEWLPLANLVKA